MYNVLYYNIVINFILKNLLRLNIHFHSKKPIASKYPLLEIIANNLE